VLHVCMYVCMYMYVPVCIICMYVYVIPMQLIIINTCTIKVTYITIDFIVRQILYEFSIVTALRYIAM